MEQWQSNAQWPLDVYRGPYGDGISTDTHQTESAARFICEALEREGFGGEGRNFPIRTWVSKVATPAKGESHEGMLQSAVAACDKAMREYGHRFEGVAAGDGMRAALTSALAQNTQGEAVAYVWQYRVKGRNEWRDAEGPINSEYDKEMWETRRVYLHAERARVPDELDPFENQPEGLNYADGWNACREAMLAAAPSQRAAVKP